MIFFITRNMQNVSLVYNKIFQSASREFFELTDI